MPTRARDAGVTLVEVLVVLVLVGVAAGAVALGLGPAARGPDARAEARILAARMRRAADEALLTGRPVALLWTEDAYRFVALDAGGGWAPHPVPLLAERRALSGGLRLDQAPGAFAVTAAALPAEGAPLDLGLAGGDDAARVVWDGVAATLAEPAP